MFEVGAILYGYFKLSDYKSKHKYAIVFDLSEEACLVTTFTTSQPRSGSLNPVHGPNPSQKPYKSYVFLKGIEIGICPDSGQPFSFREDTTVVPDLGFTRKTIKDFYASVTDLRKVCQLNKNEIVDLMYAILWAEKTPNWVKVIFNDKLSGLCDMD